MMRSVFFHKVLGISKLKYCWQVLTTSILLVLKSFSNGYSKTFVRIIYTLFSQPVVGLAFGASPSNPYRRSINGPCWGTFVPRVSRPLICPSLEKILRVPMVCRCAIWRTTASFSQHADFDRPYMLLLLGHVFRTTFHNFKADIGLLNVCMDFQDLLA